MSNNEYDNYLNAVNTALSSVNKDELMELGKKVEPLLNDDLKKKLMEHYKTTLDKEKIEKKSAEEEKKEKEYHKRVELFINVTSNILSRYRNLKDPVMRHMMFIDKLYLILDFGLGAMETIDDIPPQLKQKIDTLIDDTKKDLSDLSQWIMTANSTNNDDLEDADIKEINKLKGIVYV